MELPLSRAQRLAPAVVRGGLALVILWFGLSQLVSPGDWVSWVPSYAANLIPPALLVLMNGIVETVLGAALLFGFWTRAAAVLLTLHLLHLTITMGYNDIGVRDFGLMLAMLSVSLHGSDELTLDVKLRKAKSTPAAA